MTTFILNSKSLTDCERIRELIDLEKPMLDEVDSAELWDAIRFQDLRRVAQLSLRQRLRYEQQDEPERELIPYDYETGIMKTGEI